MFLAMFGIAAEIFTICKLFIYLHSHFISRTIKQINAYNCACIYCHMNKRVKLQANLPIIAENAQIYIYAFVTAVLFYLFWLHKGSSKPSKGQLLGLPNFAYMPVPWIFINKTL